MFWRTYFEIHNIGPRFSLVQQRVLTLRVRVEAGLEVTSGGLASVEAVEGLGGRRFRRFRLRMSPVRHVAVHWKPKTIADTFDLRQGDQIGLIFRQLGDCFSWAFF
jgi:hypothetical protein